MPLPYVTVDVFTDDAFGGNPLAVVFGGEHLSTEQMHAITRECTQTPTPAGRPASQPPAILCTPAARWKPLLPCL